MGVLATTRYQSALQRPALRTGGWAVTVRSGDKPGSDGVKSSPDMLDRESRSFEKAFQEEFERHYSSLFRYLDRLSGDPDLAADVAQDAFIRLYRRGALPANTRSWLLVVARNLFRNARSKSRRRRHLLVGESARDTMGDPGPSPMLSLEAARKRKRVRSALDRLPEREREMLLLRYSGFSYREIAEALELKETSVGTLLVRAKEAFRRAVEVQGDAP